MQTASQVQSGAAGPNDNLFVSNGRISVQFKGEVLILAGSGPSDEERYSVERGAALTASALS